MSHSISSGFLVWIALLFFSLSAGAAQAGTRVLKLVQVHDVSGGQTVYLAKDAVRIENGSTGLILFCREPFNEVVLANPKSHCFKRLKMIQAVQMMRGMQLLCVLTDFPSDQWSKPKETSFNGLKALVYDSKGVKGGSWRRYWVLEQKVPSRLIQLICACNGMPEQFGVPLKMQQFVAENYMPTLDRSMGEKSKTEMQFLSKVAEEVSVPGEMMNCPRDFKETKNSSTVLAGCTGWTSLKEINDSPDFLFKSSDRQIQSGRPSATTGPFGSLKRHTKKSH